MSVTWSINLLLLMVKSLRHRRELKPICIIRKVRILSSNPSSPSCALNSTASPGQARKTHRTSSVTTRRNCRTTGSTPSLLKEGRNSSLRISNLKDIVVQYLVSVARILHSRYILLNDRHSPSIFDVILDNTPCEIQHCTFKTFNCSSSLIISCNVVV